MKKIQLFSLFSLVLIVVSCNNQPPYKNPDLPIDKRVDDLVSRMTLDEKISQMMNSAAPIERLGIPAYNWWSEGLHGVANSGNATVFPQAIGLGATWDSALIHKMADIVSTEFRGKYNDYIQKNDHALFHGLTVWSPNVNIFRDPRWGRGQETYGEDPYLTGTIGVAFVKGLQGDNPQYLKCVSTPKHFAVHSGPEPLRHKFNAVIDDRDFLETYVPQFEMCIREGGAWSIMGAYNSLLGVPCCASDKLLKTTLREKWGFKGYVVSDCGAIDNIYKDHAYVKTPEEAAAIAVKTGCDLECGETYRYLKEAVVKGLITEKEIDVSIKRLFTARMKLGMFDPQDRVPFNKLSLTDVDTKDHRNMALVAARKSMVLLKNEHRLLPLSKQIKQIALIGPNANNAEVLYGNYNGTSDHPVTVYQGIKSKLPDAEVIYEKGCGYTDDEVPALSNIDSSCLQFNGQQGLQGTYYKGMEMKGAPIAVRIDKQLNFDSNNHSFQGGIPTEGFSVRWTGKLIPKAAGEYILGITGDDGYRLFIDDKKVIENWSDHGASTMTINMKLEKGRTYDIKIEYYQNGGGYAINFGWNKTENASRDKKLQMEKAIQNVSKADVIVMVGGISSSLEGEEMSVHYQGFEGGAGPPSTCRQYRKNCLKSL